MLVITHADVVTPGERLRDRAVVVAAGRIAAIVPASEAPAGANTEVLDASGQTLAPGFIDLQVNGAFGKDFTADPASIWDVAAQYARYGVTGFLPTIITSPLETVAAAQVIVCRPPAGFRGAEPFGLHVEGPFLNPARKGAHNPSYLRLPTLEAVSDWSPQAGVRLVTLAPELPGALDVIAALSARGILVSTGHSMATYAEALAAFDAGARYGTHLFNAMPPLAHREPGLPGALLTDNRVCAGFIPDGIHTHPAIIRLAWQQLGCERFSMVTDCMAALGMGPGRHLLGDFEVFVDGNSARLADGTLAGSILSLDQGIRNLIRETGCSLEDALAAVTTTPARLLGLAHERGRVAPGYVADMVLLSTDLQVQATIARGQIVYRH
ncbi:MAG: N-acetylglucosamine-6-phosphate deacetylase [Nitrososphaerales archaeon]